MPCLPLYGQHEPAIAARRCQTVCCKPLQARTILQPRRPADVAGQAKPVQRRTAARLEIRLVPHPRTILPGARDRKHRRRFPFRT